MKNISIIVLAFFLLTTFSCKKQLEEYNPGGLTAEAVYTTPAGFDALVNAAYGYQRMWYGKEEGYNMSEMGTDLWMSAAGDIAPDLSQYINLQGTNSLLKLQWNAFYAGINLCNAGINRIGGAGYTAATQKQREGELRFLRAFYYWHIVETWGGVHFTTRETSDIISTANKTPVDTFYAQIFRDLNFAVNNLSATTPEYGRVTKPAAMAFLARMYLTRGMNVEATAMANAVIKGGFGYVLQPNYRDLWNMGFQKNSKEVIYAVNYATTLTFNDLNTGSYNIGHSRGSHNGHLHFLMKYDNLPRMGRIIEYGRPFNRYMPTRALLDLYGPGDSRYAGSFRESWNSCTGNSNDTAKSRPGDTAIIATRTLRVGTTLNTEGSWSATNSIGMPYKIYNRNTIYDAVTGKVRPVGLAVYPSLIKHMDSTRLSYNEAQSAKDVFVIRYAELFLIAAEAQMNLGRTDSAAYFINILRTRAAEQGQVAAMQITPAQVNIDFILDERAREFAGEQLRWFDLKRTGKLQARVQALNPDVAPNIQSYHSVRPIPQSQLDAVTNKEEFKQNPGYQ